MMIFRQATISKDINYNKIYFCGFFYYENTLYKGESAISFISKNVENIHERIDSFNGSFYFVVDNPSKIILACDRLRSRPLFYRIKDNDFSVSDCAEDIRNDSDTFNDAYVEEFSTNSLWMSKDKTLLNEIRQVCAGQIVFINKTNLVQSSFDYFHFNYKKGYKKEQLKLEFWSVYDNVGKRLVEVLNGRTAVIPLSGGYDSRMVLEMLIRQQYQNIICFTYGNLKSDDCVISRKVARKYNCKWIFVEYTREYHNELWEKGLYKSYYKYAGNYSSLPHTQDFAAVYELKQKKLIPQDSVFIPGHTGDMLAGNHIPKEFLDCSMDESSFVRIFDKKYYGGRPGYGCDYAKEVYESIGGACDVLQLLEKYEEINIKERQAKFIVNSCRVYEFFGYDWFIPLWDYELIEFWQKVPVSERYQRKLYIECVGGNLKTTNDNNVYRKIKNVFRKYDNVFSFIKTIGKVRDYWDNPLKIYALFSFREYFICNLKSKGTDNANLLFNKKYLNFILEDSNQHAKNN